MPFRNRLKRIQGKVKGTYQAHEASGSPATPIISLPNVLINPADTEDPSMSDIEGIRTSAPIPDSLSCTQSPSPNIGAISLPEANPSNKEAHSTPMLPHVPTILPSFTHVSSSQDIVNGISIQLPSSTLSSDQRPPSGGPVPKQVTVTEDNASRTIDYSQNLQFNDSAISPTPNVTNKNGNDYTQLPPTPPNPQAILGGENSMTESAVAAHEFDPVSEPATAAQKNTRTLTWECLNRFRRALKSVSSGFGPLRPVIDGLGDCIDIYDSAMQSHQDYQALRSELESLFGVLSEHFSGHVPPTMTAAMNNLCIAIEVELDHISTKESRGRFRLYQEVNRDLDDIMQCYRRVYAHLERLKLNADLSTWKVVDELAVETRLKSLLIGPVLAACYDSAEARELGRRECTPETRKQVLQGLSHWRHDRETGNIYWLNGMAGTGKTTIASSLCAMLDKSHELGASFFCSRLLPYCRDIKLILPAIAYQLARYSHPLRCALFLALREESDLPSKSLLKQIEGLLVKPLRQVADALPTDLVVVMDALDECDDSQGVGLLLELLLKHASDLPIKVFVSSRPEPRIRQMIGDVKSQLILHELEDSIVKEDIKLYLQTELDGLLPSISDAGLVDLANKAGILFIYAATVVRFIRSTTSVLLQQKRFKDLLTTSKSGKLHQHQVIDTLYDTVLTSVFDSSDLQDNEKGVMKLVLDTVICTREPLTVTAIARLLKLEDESLVQAALDPLWSVLHIYSTNGLVTILHASFPEYMLDPTRSKGYGCSAGIHHGQLAKLCFDRIKNNKLQFNVCGLESSFVLDDQVPNLEERVIEAVPHELMYACQYWALHLELGEPSVERLQELAELVSERLLLWIEILNLIKKIMVAALMLSKTEAWCKTCSAPQKTKDMVHEAWQFATVFAMSGAARSTPHLYVSMLASWTNPGQLLDKYKSRTKGLVRVEGTGIARRKPGLLSTFQVGSKVMSVASSPDGKTIASGSSDKTVRVWDVSGGTILTGPITGHTSTVNSVAFSPDSQRIVSGSDDKTIRVWNTTSGKSIVSPITGHTSAVTSVAFSPDGTRLLSGSEDKTLRLWDAKSGKPVMNPIIGHTSSVTSVAFSADGTRIVSGSDDNTVRVWEATSGAPLTDPITGHRSAITSVAFSPDSTRIVSGSEDTTLRVWDAKNGKSVMHPIEGHLSPVTSVSFSPDGRRIASGSSNYRISVWDASSGKPLVETIMGHGFDLSSLAFSPDGTRIVSGAWDSTISVWEPASLRLVGLLDVLTSREAALILIDAIKMTVSIVRDIFRLLWGSTISRRMAETATEPIVPDTALNQVMGTRDRSGLRLAGGIIQTVLKNPITVFGIVPVYSVWAHFHTVLTLSTFILPDATSLTTGCRTLLVLRSFFGVRLLLGERWVRLFGEIRVRRAKEIRAVLEVANYFFKLDFYWYYLVLALCALEDLILPVVSAQGRMFTHSLSNRAPQLSDRAIQVKDAVKIFISSRVSATCLKLLSVLFQTASWNGFPDWVYRMLMPAFIYSCEIFLFEEWKLQYSIRSAVSSPDGAYIVSGSDDNTIRVWDSTSGVPLTDPIIGHTAAVTLVAFSPDGTRILSGSDDKTLRLWDARSRKPVMDPLTGHTSPITSAAFSADSMHIVSGSDDNTIRLWDATSGVSLADPITGHTSAAISVAFSPDGMRIVSGHKDDTIHVWDAKSGQEVTNFGCPGAGELHSVAFLPDGVHIVSFSSTWTVLVWDTSMSKVHCSPWLPGEEGWVVDNQGNLLLWLPADLHQRLLSPQCLYSISSRGLVTLNFDGANIGDSWAECYVCA